MKKTACALALATMSVAPMAQAENLILSTANPPGHFAVVNGVQPFMTCVEGKDVDLSFNFFPSGQIANYAGALDALNSGLAQVSYVSPTFISDKFPLANISVLPNMGMNSTQMNEAWRRVLEAGGPMADEIKANKMEVLYVHMYPPYQVGLRDKKIDTVADFGGQKLRVSGGSQVFAVEALDSVPVQISGADSYVAMQQGTVDGYLLAPTSVDSYKLQEVTKTLSTNTNFAGAIAFLSMDTDYFAALSEEKQKALKECGAEVEKSVVDVQDNYIAELQTKFEEAGVELYALPDATLAELNETLELAVTDYIKRLSDLGIPAQAALDQYREALGQ